MASLIVLAISTGVIRALGWFGVEAFSSWQSAVLYGLAVMFTFTAINHFTKVKEDMIKMVPANFPYPRQIVFITGIFEFMGAIGLLLPPVRALAGLCLIILLVAMFPANVKAALNGLTIRGKVATPLWIRVPMQLLYIGLIWWVSF